MKVWQSFGSEHSSNTVLIGRFLDSMSAEKAREAIDRLSELVLKIPGDYLGTVRYPDEILEYLRSIQFHSLAPSELEQFANTPSCSLKDKELTLRTDESDISGFLKLMIDFGAKVEAYSGHIHPSKDDDNENDDEQEDGAGSTSQL